MGVAKTQIQIGQHPLQSEIVDLLGRDPTKRSISATDFAEGMAAAGKEDDDKIKAELTEQGKQLYKAIKERKKKVADIQKDVQKGDDAITKIFTNLKQLRGGSEAGAEDKEEAAVEAGNQSS